MANSSKALLIIFFRPLGLKLTIDLVNFAAAKGKMFVMQKHANLSHELTYFTTPPQLDAFRPKKFTKL